MSEYQEGLHALLDDVDWQEFTDRRDGSPKRFVKRTGWRKVATWFGVDLLLDDERIHVDYRDDVPVRARVVARVVAPNGRVAEDVGVCAASERRFSKPDHDIVATAATRALNRATSNLVGMGELSAEEVDDAGPAGDVVPAWAQSASDQLLIVMRAKLDALVGGQRARALERAIAERYGFVPNITTGFVNAVHSMLMPELLRAREQRTTPAAQETDAADTDD